MNSIELVHWTCFGAKTVRAFRKSFDAMASMSVRLILAMSLIAHYSFVSEVSQLCEKRNPS